MKFKPLFVLFFLSSTIFSFGQNPKEVLFTIDGDPVFVDSFKRMFSKNQELMDDNSNNNVDNYLQLFIDYSLKIREAKAEKLNENPKFLNEYNKYRTQLAQKYITKSEVTDELLQEAYQRLKTAVNASHILILVDQDALPVDTLKAYKRIMEIRQKIMDGMPFSKAAMTFSEDKSAQKNSGKLGWFRVFKMVYPFENAAYQTPVGEISMPVRTQFGYHLIKVNEKRPAKGELKVAHIMLLENGNDSVPNPQKRINELYAQLKNGASFEELAIKFSEDKNSASNGGVLNWFEPGDLRVKNFGEVAFSLKVGDFSEPFQTEYGWHIVKSLEKRPVGSYEENKTDLEKKIKNDSRAHLISDDMFHNLREFYHIGNNLKIPDFFKSFVTDSILKGSWKFDPKDIPAKDIVKIGDSAKTYLDFATYLLRRQKNVEQAKDKEILLNKWLNDFVNNSVLDYQRAHLEKINPEFAAIAKEYYNGLLLFDLMEQKIWYPAKKDSLELKKYFKKHKKEYPTENFEEVRGLVQNDYQKQLEEQWMVKLHEKYTIKINKKNLKKVKAYFEKSE